MVTDSQLLDLVKATLNDLGKPDIQMIATSLQDYEVMGKLMKGDKVIQDGGKGIQKTLMLKMSSTAQYKGRYAEDNLNVPNLLEQMTVSWVHADDGWAMDKAEPLQNTGKSLINNIINPRRANCMLGLIDLMETGFFQAVTTDTTQPKGLNYWIVKNATAGFNGGLPSGYNDVCGVNLTTYPNFKNYTDQYTAVSPEDLIAKMRLASYKTNFKSPIDISDLKTVGQSNKKIYTTFAVYSKFVTLAQQQNENLGADVDKYNGMVMFNRNEIKAIPKLDELALDDVYLLNFDSFYPVVLKGSYMRESDPIISPKAHNVIQNFIDIDFNYICINRRANAVIDDSNT